MNEARERYAEIDALKVAGIVTIVLIHSLRAPWDPAVAPLEVWIGHATRFGVPAFLFASGFLYAARGGIAWATLAGRLRRILLPYLLASLAAQLFCRFIDRSEGTGQWWLDLLIGASFGPYYYVFVIVCLVAISPFFARLPAAALWAGTGLFAALQAWVDIGASGWIDVRWHLRSPLLWWAYFLLGWSVRLHLPAIRAFVDARRGALLVGLGLAVVALTALSGFEGTLPRAVVRSAAWLDVYAILAWIFVAAGALAGVPPWMRFASDATYALYLFHLFFLIPAQLALPLPAGALSASAVLVPWLCGLAGPLLLVAAARSLLGPHSRSVIGA